MNSLTELSNIRPILNRLRLPCARSAALRYPYNASGRTNFGITIQFPVSELSVVAPGDGVVTAVELVQPTWAYSTDQLHVTQSSYLVVLDHGSGVSTLTHGMSACQVNVGQAVKRGQVLGPRTDREVFFAVKYLDNPYDPIGINRHFKTQNGSTVIGQGGLFRFAPDFVPRDLANGLMSTLVGGYRYFTSITCAVPPFLVNVDMSGSGQKSGLAAAGIGALDYWNVYAPQAFTETVSGVYMCSGSQFNVNPVFELKNYSGAQSVARFERVSPMVPDNGTTVRFDAMLSTWLGGEILGVPISNSFKVRGLPAGSYDILMYAGGVSVQTDFYVSVNAGAPSTTSITPTVLNNFQVGDNYASFNVVLALYDVVTIKAVGRWSGVQIKRR